MPSISMPDINMPSPSVYRADVQQGNILTKKMVDRLKIGMQKQEVRWVLGSPLVVSTFNQERWDYYYSMKPGNEEVQRKHLVLFFSGDRLARMEKKNITDVSEEEKKEK